MNRAEFSKNINPHNIFDCYSDEIKARAKACAIPEKLSKPYPNCIKKANRENVCGNLTRHHIYPKKLFLYKSCYTTLIIEVSKEIHDKLHTLLAEEKYEEYENLIKIESDGVITEPIAQNIIDRIAQI